MKPEDIDAGLIKKLQDGDVILFLGSGASADAKNPLGQSPPIGSGLGVLLSEQFLGGKYNTYPLDQIGDYAISEYSLGDVEYFIRDIFKDFQPTPHHCLISSFRWRAIVTTNYDTLIEEAYQQSKNRVQDLVPIIDNSDRIQHLLSSPNAVPLLKLHGCITRVNKPECPLILSKDQYINYRQGRSNLFDHFYLQALDFPILFAGYSIGDSDVREIMNEVLKVNSSRPRYYAITRGMDQVQKNYWGERRITGMAGTFSQMMDGFDARIPSAFRGIGRVTAQPNNPIFAHFSRNPDFHPITLKFIDEDVEYVKNARPVANFKAADFYQGIDPGWYSIEQNLDVRRELNDQILEEFFLDETKERDGAELILIRASAGSGKSVAMRRLAWDAAHDYNRLCLYLLPNGTINPYAIQEIIQGSGERLYLFVDNAADRVREISSLFNSLGKQASRLTVVVAERPNEWNVACGPLSPLVTESYELEYLNNKEIERLLVLLEKNKALGKLEGKTLEERRRALEERAGRQLLVALHEAHYGDTFLEILRNEYDNIFPLEARSIYRTVCALNRLGIPVRAGIIARLYKIRFEDFEDRFFGPLEHVVIPDYNYAIQDHVYKARHPLVAQWVFTDICFRNQEERYLEYVGCLNELVLGYDADRKAFRQMIRAVNLIEYFPNHELASRIFQIAEGKVGDSGHDFIHYLHQKGIYEMRRPNANLRDATEILSRAMRIAPRDLTLKNSMAELLIRRAEEEGSLHLQRERFLSEAISLGRAIVEAREGDAHGHTTLLKAWIARLRYLVQDEARFSPKASEEISKEIERILTDGYQRFPNDPYLLRTEAEYADVLQEYQRALASLQASFAKNNRNTFTAIRLAANYERQGDMQSAEATLRQALNANSGERKLHYHYGKLLMKLPNSSPSELRDHFRLSFTPGDQNYDAQLLYGRQLFILGEIAQSRVVFQKLKRAQVWDDVKNKLNYPMPEKFQGRVDRMEVTHCWILRDNDAVRIYAPKSEIAPELWRKLNVNSQVSFRIAFSFKGPGAQEVQMVTGIS